MDGIFKEGTKKKGHKDNPIGLSQRKPLDGKKADEKMSKEEKDFNTVHIEGIGDKSDKLARDIKTILQGKVIKKLCDSDIDIRLIPQYNYTESVAFNKKVKACIMVQKQFMAQIDTMELELDSVETVIKEGKNKSVRELILDMNKEEKIPKTLFIEKKWNNQGYKVFYPKKTQNRRRNS